MSCGNFELRASAMQTAAMGFEDFFGEVHNVHLVDCGDDGRDSKKGGDAGMAARLIEDAFARVDEDDGNVGRRCSGGHVARVLLVAGRVGDDEFALRR